MTCASVKRGRSSILHACAALVLLIPGTAQAEDVHFGMIAAGSGSLDRGGAAYRLGGRYRASDRWTFGADVEHNPWFSIETVSAVPGVINAYLTASFRWTRFEGIELASTAHAGISVLLFDLYSAEAGSTGPYLGLSLLGVSIDLSPGVALVIEPADVSIPIPQLRGVPFVYRQYRLTVGVRWWL